jgi:hypothetical protein
MVSNTLFADALAGIVKDMLVSQMDVKGVPEKEAVLLTGKKLPGEPLGRRRPLDPGMAEDVALLEAEIVADI